MVISSVPEHDESHESDPNSDITDPSDIESDAELRDPEPESNPELESNLGSNNMAADSSFDASTSTKIDYRNFQLEPYVEEFPWLYYNVLEKGYKYKNCKLFPAIGSGNATHKFGKDAVKSVTDHPRRLLQRHEESKKHQNSSKEYEGMYKHFEDSNQNEQTSAKSNYIFYFYFLRMCSHNEDTSAINDMKIILNQCNNNNIVTTITVTITKSKDNNHITFQTTKHNNKFKMTVDFFC